MAEAKEKKETKKVKVKKEKTEKNTKIEEKSEKKDKVETKETVLETKKEITSKKQATPDIDVKKLLEAGVHFGHQTRRWNPKIAPYIFTKKNNIHIIDLIKTAEKLEEALLFVQEVTRNGGNILFVGTKTQAQEIIKGEAEKSGSPYVSHKWLGGMLTNYATVVERIKYLKNLEKRIEEEKFVTKKEKLDATNEVKKMNETFGGIKEMKKIPDAIFIVDITMEKNAVLEAKKLNIPVVAIVDTNADPEMVTYPIPANDDAIKGIKLITEAVAETIVKSKANLR